MKIHYPTRSTILSCLLLFILCAAGVSNAGDIALAAKLRAPLQQTDGFSAEYLAQSEKNKEGIRIKIAYRSPDQVYIGIPTQKTYTIYDGKSLLLLDIPTGSAIRMKTDSLKSLVKNASDAFKDLKPWIDENKLREYQNLFAYPVVSMTKSGLDVAVGFSAVRADASWLRVVEMDQAKVRSAASVITARHGEYLLTVDAKSGILKSMVDKTSPSNRVLKLVALNDATPDGIMFDNRNAGSGGESAVRKTEPGRSLVNTVIQRQFQMILRNLTEKEAPVFKAMRNEEKKRIAGAVRQYWRTVFQSDDDLKKNLTTLAASKESRELIKMQLMDEKAFGDFKAKNESLALPDLQNAWADAVGAAFSRQILMEALAPMKRGIVLDAAAYLKLLAAKSAMSDAEINQMVQEHVDPMENALIETLGMTIYEKILSIANEYRGETGAVKSQ